MYDGKSKPPSPERQSNVVKSENNPDSLLRDHGGAIHRMRRESVFVLEKNRHPERSEGPAFGLRQVGF
jgi:hypothetical protein